MMRLFFYGLLFLMTGCASIGHLLNPYESDFLCADRTTTPGKCVTIEEAYRESFQTRTDGAPPPGSSDAEAPRPAPAPTPTDGEPPVSSDTPCATCGVTSLPAGAGPAAINSLPQVRIVKEYETALMKRYTDILKQPNTPMMVPPRQIRVLLLPYRGENRELYASRYIYMLLDEPTWVLDPLL